MMRPTDWHATDYKLSHPCIDCTVLSCGHNRVCWLLALFSVTCGVLAGPGQWWSVYLVLTPGTRRLPGSAQFLPGCSSGQCRCQHRATSHLWSADCQHCIMSLTGGSQDLLENVWMWLLHVRGCTIVLCYVAINAMTEHISNETWSHSLKYFWNFHKIFLKFLEPLTHSGACHVSGVKGYGYSELISSYKDNTAKYSRTEAEAGGPSVSITSLLISSIHHCCVTTVSVSFFSYSFVSWPLRWLLSSALFICSLDDIRITTIKAFEK